MFVTKLPGHGDRERRPRPGNRRHVDVLATARALDLFNRFDLAGGALVATAAAHLAAADRAALAAAVPALERLRDVLADRRPAPPQPSKESS